MNNLQKVWEEEIKAIEQETTLTKRQKQNRIKKIDQRFSILQEITEKITTIKINVEWKKSQTWGSNPTASISIYTDQHHVYCYDGHASGCGYDKESASVASALNQSDLIKIMLLDFAGDRFNIDTDEKIFSYGIHNYGKGFYYFSGGVGMYCFVRSFKKMGFEVNEMHGKSFDGYIFIRSIGDAE